MSSDRFARLLTRLVERDAAQAYGMLAVGVAFAAIFVGRAWPPHEIRAAIVAADPWTRALALAGAAGLYLVMTAPIARRLLASQRLAYLRHLPVAPRRWRAIHLRHLLGIHSPWFFAGAYGLASPSLTIGVAARIALALAWASWTIVAQVLVVHTKGARRLLLAGLAWITTIAGVVLSGSIALAIITATIAAALTSRVLLRIPPERSSRALRWPWSPRRPTLALARLDALVLLRREPAVLRRRALHSLGIAAIGAAAILAASRAGEPVDPWIVRWSGLFAAFFAAHLVIVAHRALDRDRWVLDASAPTPAVILGARIVTGALASTPALALWIGARIGVAGDPPLEVAFEAALAGLLAPATMTWASARAEAERRLHRTIFAGPALILIAALTLWSLSATVITLAPLLLGLLFAARREIARAEATRRRLETSRKDDDHE